MFARQGTKLGRTNIIKHTIQTGEAKPARQPPRRIPPPFLEEVNRLVDKMVKNNAIKPFKSMWAYPIALMEKSDLKIGYWQVKVAGTDREKAAFTVPNWLYGFQAMLFVLCNAAATFQYLMQTALTGPFPKHCTIYLDDILVFGKDMLEHNANLKLVLDCLQDAGLTLNPKKCHFLQRPVTFQGHTVSSDGMLVTEIRTERFVKGFAKIASSLHKLIQKQAERKFKWEDEHDEAFKELRRMLCFASILALPNFENNASLY
ncbi:hypothetical protein TSMEX_011158 [Taenia solium]|eukprot:TsM_000913900 transcript=TsM_000913900 gene=TsM_000913900